MTGNMTKHFNNMTWRFSWVAYLALACAAPANSSSAQSCCGAGGRTGLATPKTRCKVVLTYPRAQMVLHRVSGLVAPACSPTWCPSVAFRVHDSMWLQIPGSAVMKPLSRARFHLFHAFFNHAS